MSNLRLLIVDDEPLIRLGIRNGLRALDDIEVIGECDTGAQAIEAIRSLKPQLVLLDVQMPDGTGLDVVRQIGAEKMAMVIFVTAYDEYAVKAFELNAVDYLLKPFDEERLHQSISRARERLSAQNQSLLSQRLQNLLEARTPAWPERLVVKEGERYDFVPTDAIDWIESANNYVQLHCGPKSHLMGETMTGLERKLDPRKFLRVHRGRIVNVSRITAVHPMMHGSYTLEMRNGVRLTTGKQYKHAVQALMGR